MKRETVLFLTVCIAAFGGGTAIIMNQRTASQPTPIKSTLAKPMEPNGDEASKRTLEKANLMEPIPRPQEQVMRAKEVRIIVWDAFSGGLIIGGPYHGSLLPGKNGGMVVGGPLNGSAWPDSKGGMIVGGPLNGTVWPRRRAE